MNLPKDKTYCIYRHLKPCGEVFYIGIGSTLKRPYDKKGRSDWWKKVVSKYSNYEIQILKTDLTKDEACELEIVLIDYYGRIDCCGGTLVNLTNGGETTYGRVMEQWQRDFMSRTFKGKWVGEDNPNFGNYWTDDQKKHMSNLKKEGFKNGTLTVNIENTFKGIAERNRRWEENPQLKQDMIKKISDIHNIYEYLKIDRDTREVLEVFQSRVEIKEKYPNIGKTTVLSVCNGWKQTYLGFIWRYRDRETGEIIEPEKKWLKNYKNGMGS